MMLETPLNGYHWCDHCDESANGKICLTCRKPARWVPAEKIPPAEWFRRMHEQISHLETP